MNIRNIKSRYGDRIIISNRCSLGEKQYINHRIDLGIRKYYQMADKIVSCSFGAKYDLTNNYGISEELIQPIYNFINKTDIIKKSKEKIVDNRVYEFVGESKVIINVGRLDRQKNQHKLLVQFKCLIDEGVDAVLIIIGSGKLESFLKKEASELNIDGKVLFLPYCENPFPFYCIADIMACTTDYEGLPNVILEAMILGLPVVSVDCLSGPMELLKNCYDYDKRTKGIEICERGILVEKTDTDMYGSTKFFANAMQIMLSNLNIYHRIKKNEIDYMVNYNNDSILKEWIYTIENTAIKNDISCLTCLTEIDGERNVIVYGVGYYGKRIMNYILKSKKEYEFLAFAVTNVEKNPTKIMNIPVFGIADLLMYRHNSTVIIGVLEDYDNQMANLLDLYGFKYIYSDL